MSAYTLVWFLPYYRCFLAIDILFKLCYTLVIKTLPLIAPGGSPLLNQSRNCPSSKFGIQYFTVTSSWRILCHTHVWSPIFIVQPSWFVVKSVCILTFVAWISISSGQLLFFLLVIPNFSLAHLMHYEILFITIQNHPNPMFPSWFPHVSPFKSSWFPWLFPWLFPWFHHPQALVQCRMYSQLELTSAVVAAGSETSSLLGDIPWGDENKNS